MTAVAMLTVALAGFQGSLRFVQGVQPRSSIGARLGVTVSIDEAPLEELPQRRMQDAKGKRRRHGAIGPTRPGPVGEMSQGDADLEGRRIARPRVPARVRVRAFHEKLENQYGQSKRVMLGHAVDVGEGLVLKLRRRELGRADGAAIDEPRLRIAHLKRVGVNQGHQRGFGDEDVGLVDVADDVAAEVQGPHGGGKVARRAVQVAVVEQRALLTAGPGVVVIDDGTKPGHTVHEKADETSSAVGGLKEVHRPSNRDVPLRRHGIDRRVGDHGGELALVPIRGVVVHFRHQARLFPQQ